jgi:hypothetical protein
VQGQARCRYRAQAILPCLSMGVGGEGGAAAGRPNSAMGAFGGGALLLARLPNEREQPFAVV